MNFRVDVISIQLSKFTYHHKNNNVEEMAYGAQIPQDKTIKKNNVIFTTPNSLIVGKIRNFHVPISIDKSKITKKQISMCIIEFRYSAVKSRVHRNYHMG